MPHKPEVLRIYTPPLMLFFISLLGLVAALLGDGMWDWFSWVLLTVIVLSCFWHPFVRYCARKQR